MTSAGDDNTLRNAVRPVRQALARLSNPLSLLLMELLAAERYVAQLNPELPLSDAEPFRQLSLGLPNAVDERTAGEKSQRPRSWDDVHRGSSTAMGSSRTNDVPLAAAAPGGSASMMWPGDSGLPNAQPPASGRHDDSNRGTHDLNARDVTDNTSTRHTQAASPATPDHADGKRPAGSEAHRNVDHAHRPPRPDPSLSGAAQRDTFKSPSIPTADVQALGHDAALGFVSHSPSVASAAGDGSVVSGLAHTAATNRAGFGFAAVEASVCPSPDEPTTDPSTAETSVEGFTLLNQLSDEILAAAGTALSARALESAARPQAGLPPAATDREFPRRSAQDLDDVASPAAHRRSWSELSPGLVPTRSIDEMRSERSPEAAPTQDTDAFSGHSLADLVNQVLAAQARRHGVDLS